MKSTLVDTDIEGLIDSGAVRSEFDLKSETATSEGKRWKYIQPSSLEMPIGRTAYIIKEKFLPFSRNVEDILEKATLEEISLDTPKIIYRGQTIITKCLDIDMPEHLIGLISPKSSIGRTDILVRNITDGLGFYDFVTPKKSGSMWLEISPTGYNIKISSGMTFNQLRFLDKRIYSTIDISGEDVLFDDSGNRIQHEIFEESQVIMHLNVGSGKHIGYESVYSNEAVDLSRNNNDWRVFFKKIIADETGRVTLEKDRFYILTTKESIYIPPKFSAEMIPVSHLIGELRVHYAGFFDPNFTGSGVLEVRPHENITICDGQPICLVEFFYNIRSPKFLYGAGNNYRGQKGPRLAKFFTQPE